MKALFYFSTVLFMAFAQSGAAQERGRYSTEYKNGEWVQHYTQPEPEKPYRYELGFSVCSPGSASDIYHNRGSIIIGCVDYHELGLGDLFGTHSGAVNSLGTYVFDASVYVKPWLMLGACTSISYHWNDIYDNRTGLSTGQQRGAAVHLIPELKNIYNRRDRVRFYSSLGFGLGFYAGSGYEKMRSSDNHPSSVHCRPAIQYSPIGFMCGEEWSVFAEIGAGFVYNGVRAGVSYRF